MSTPSEVRFLERAGTRLAFAHSPGAGPVVVFLGGFASDMGGAKALFLEARCRERAQAFLRLDYSGHGRSGGRFADGDITRWTEDARHVIAAVTGGDLLLVGSSMGGWVMLLLARALRERVRALVGVAAAPDFTEELLWSGLGEARREALWRDGAIEVPSAYSDEPYTITRRLIEDGRRHLLLQAPIDVDCPVRLLHGLEDADVPWQTSIELAAALRGEDVRLTLVKGAGHRFSTPRELALIDASVRELSADCAGDDHG